ncbi:MAG TPA: hypothetical protein VFP90_09170 [Gemmatimonadaceae bacterium]|nr:hypothetical protein [Gemmatimonadaceae bacterium]
MIRPARATLGIARFIRCTLLCIALSGAVSLGAGAQDTAAAAPATTREVRTGWIAGPLIGLPGVGSEYDVSFFTLGFGATRLVPFHAGVDFAIGTVPRAVGEGFFPIGVRVGPSIPLALGRDAFVVPSAGLSFAGAFGTGGAIGIGGVYGGVSTVIAHGSAAFRAGVTWHRPPDERFSLWLVEIGLMHVPLPHRTL